jgi:hypothetical protein
VARECAVGEAVAVFGIGVGDASHICVNCVHNSRGVGPPEAAGAGDDEDGFAGAERGVVWECLEPAEFELLPALEGSFGTFEGCGTLS